MSHVTTDPDDPDRTGRHDDAPTSSSDDAQPGTVIAGKYKLLEAIGEGGMGSVWMALQTEPVKRHVAVKLIKAGMDSKAVLARFEAERQALAMMDHPNIARVLDAGTTTGRPFFVMELVKGTPITEFCDARRLTPRQRLELFVPVCQAIQHAHQKGIIHRDIKPSNVLVALHDDKPVPKVIDFGVAKAMSGAPLTEKTLHTGFDAVVGTPAYMSPEQATFNQLDIDTRTDVYSLGVLLYELLTGTTPIERERFKQAALVEMLRVVREEEPPRPSTRLSSTASKASIAAVRGTDPSRLTSLFRGELDWIAMKALEKDRARRYDTANGLARDVQRYLADEVVEARPPSLSYRLRKFARRHKAQVVAMTVILVALVGGLIGAAYGVTEAANQRVANSLREQAELDRDAADVARGQEQTARRAADAARDELAQEREKLARLEYGRALNVAAEEVRDNNIGAALALLDGTRPEWRGWEWRYIHRLCHSDWMSLKHQLGVACAAYSPDGTQIVTASADGTAKIWDAAGGTLIRTLSGHTNFVWSAAFSPDGTKVVTASYDRTAKVWDVRTGTNLLTFSKHTRELASASFSPDGSKVVTASYDRTARVWDAARGTELLILRGHTGIVYAASFSPDGSRIVTASEDRTAKVWDAYKGGASLKTLQGHDDHVSSASFGPDGTRIVTGSADATARVWDAETGTALEKLQGHTSDVVSAKFSPDGTRVLTGSLDRTARIWDARTGAELISLKGHTALVFSAAFSPDGSHVVTGGWDWTARIWDVTRAAEPRTLTGPGGPRGLGGANNWATLSPDGTRLASGNTSAEGRITDAGTGAKLARVPRFVSRPLSASWSANGARFVITHMNKTASVWDGNTGAQLAYLNSAHLNNAAALSPDGTRVVTGTAIDGSAIVWDVATGAELFRLTGHTGTVHSVAWSPDGKRIVTGGGSKVAEDGNRLREGKWDRSAKVWDVATGAELFRLKGHTSDVMCIAFSGDGSRIVTGSSDRTARVWDATNGECLFAMKGHTNIVLAAAFSPDGSRIVTGGNDFAAKVWNARTGDEMLTLKGHTISVGSVSFSPDGSRIVTESMGTVRIWDATPVNREFLPKELAPMPRAGQ